MGELEVDLFSSVIGTNDRAVAGLHAEGELAEASMGTTALAITRAIITPVVHYCVGGLEVDLNSSVIGQWSSQLCTL